MTRLQHAVGWYDGDAGLREQLAGVVLDELVRGGSVAVALRPVTEVALRAVVAGELGAEPVAGLIRLGREAGPDGPSGQNDVLRVARTLRACHARTGEPITVVSEYIAAFDDAAATCLAETEAAAEIALADLPVRLLCFFPDDAPGAVVETARVAHAMQLRGGVLVQTAPPVDPHRRAAGRPAELGPPVRTLAFDAGRLREVRAAVRALLRRQGFPASRTDDITVAVNEAATNAVEHGPGSGQLMLWALHGDVVCEVHDPGPLRGPPPGLAAPDRRDAHGRGMWVARQLCDLVHVWTDDAGTHVRLRARV
ncbi:MULTISPECIES: ATP-binding protein [Pseudonocardia]|uniref:Histidine kinase/HSP90-like ATPase domain-containing protein n=2 Tax=Pseudonocardia TaxID=1847 RepID=A0A1Y2N848_PSEAH|nr:MULTISPECIES: ATP-binding protein [Pseudonocardia]OSY43257.1 hypothetical protein BG845_00862 [Pseudonocardia autotrophica]TDN71745.1 anti-sigma regulatory factor (Ser/Thr protein kinase) [Pseudonocardia autotrophica]BBG02432.1 anti-sigma regulatory factor [Pseudonocardia autotrophica]GEC23232.1 anti-sigma regulatory factor [Pseudonocardia saturnea]